MKSRLVLLGVAALLAVGLTAPAFGGANALSSSAVSAKSTADKALAKANKALKKANQATQKADAAQSTADAALSSAAAAQQTADAALTAANSKYDTIDFDSTTSATDSSDKTLGLPCPSGTHIVSGGYTLTGDFNGAYVTVNQSYLNSWLVIAKDNGANATAWSLTTANNCIS